MIFGREVEAWIEPTRVGLAFLVRRAKLRRTTSYTELSATLVQRTGLRPFDFSALVIYLDDNDAGSGFYTLATDLSLLPARASQNEKFDFWVSQITALYAHYG